MKEDLSWGTIPMPWRKSRQIEFGQRNAVYEHRTAGGPQDARKNVHPESDGCLATPIFAPESSY